MLKLSFGRYRQILKVLAKYGMADLLEERGSRLVPKGVERPHADALPEETRALNLRLALQELGPTFIKFGQVLSTRPDLLPDAYIRELEKLQDKVPPFPFEEARALVEAELGRPLREAFAIFYETPLASASLAQVHEALLPGGEQVVVKIQRAEVQAIIRRDFPILRTLAQVLCSRFEWGRLYDVQGIVAELERSLKAELDFGQERRNMEVMARNLQDFPRIKVPVVYPELSTERLLVMERVFGRRPTAARKDVALAEEFLRACLRQFAVDGFFHADPHPGNVLVTRDGDLYLVDWGMVGYVDSRSRRGFTKILLSMVGGQGDMTAELFIELGEPGRDFQFHDYRLDIGRQVARFNNRGFDIGEALMQIVRIGHRHNLKAQPQLTLMFKALSQIDGIVRSLAPGVDPLDLMEPYLPQTLAQQAAQLMAPLNALNSGLEAAETAMELPRRLNTLLDRLSSDNRIRIQFEHIGLDEALGPFGRWINRLVLAFMFLGLALSSAIILAFKVGPSWLGFSVLGLLGFVASCLLGIYMLYAILRTKVL